jgi:hypothetical protein
MQVEIYTPKHVSRSSPRKYLCPSHQPVELPLPLSTTDPPICPTTCANFNVRDRFVGKDTHTAQFKGNGGGTDHDTFNGNDGFDGDDNFNGNDNNTTQFKISDTSDGSGVCVDIDNNNARFHCKDNFGGSVSFEGNDHDTAQVNGSDTSDGNGVCVGIDNNNARFHNFDGSVSFVGNVNDTAQFNGSDIFNSSGIYVGIDNNNARPMVTVFTLTLITIMLDSIARIILVTVSVSRAMIMTLHRSMVVIFPMVVVFVLVLITIMSDSTIMVTVSVSWAMNITLHSSMVVILPMVVVFVLVLITTMHDSMTRTILVSVSVSRAMIMTLYGSITVILPMVKLVEVSTLNFLFWNTDPSTSGVGRSVQTPPSNKTFRSLNDPTEERSLSTKTSTCHCRPFPTHILGSPRATTVTSPPRFSCESSSRL